MCLDIVVAKHRSKDNTCIRPIVTTEDLQTWKLLKVYNIEDGNTGVSNGYEYTAPYRGTHYTFGKLYTAKLDKRTENDWYHGVMHRVFAGLHSYDGSRTRRNRAMNRGKIDAGTSQYRWFPAVIPKGSEVYFGSRNDVVSDNLVVYRDMADLRKRGGYSTLTSPAVKVSSLHV